MAKGLLVGLCASIPLGPIGVICVQRTINRGRRSGLASGYGAAIADTLFATIAIFGLSIVIDFIETHRLLLQLLGGAIIVLLGILTLLRNPLRELRRGPRIRASYGQDILYVMLLTLTNPLAVFLFLALFAAFSVTIPPGSLWPILLVIACVHAGAFAWWFLLTSLVNRFRNRFRLRHIWWFNRIAGVTITALGAITILSAFFT